MKRAPPLSPSSLPAFGETVAPGKTDGAPRGSPMPSPAPAASLPHLQQPLLPHDRALGNQRRRQEGRVLRSVDLRAALAMERTDGSRYSERTTRAGCCTHRLPPWKGEKTEAAVCGCPVAPQAEGLSRGTVTRALCHSSLPAPCQLCLQTLTQEPGSRSTRRGF